MIEKTLYEILGVAVDATDAQIKRAFRKRVKKAHPDVGGDPDKFRAISHAYEVLSDPVRRQRYNETGQGGDPKVADAVQKAAMILSSLIMELMNGNPQGCDVVKGARMMLNERISQIRSRQETNRRGAETVRRVAAKVVKTGEGDNVIANVLTSLAGNCESDNAKLEAQAETFADVLRMLDGYRWQDDPVRTVNGIPEIPGQFFHYKVLTGA